MKFCIAKCKRLAL